jgi:uncharacterized protein with HEPN domain
MTNAPFCSGRGREDADGGFGGSVGRIISLFTNADAIASFTQGRSFEDYAGDLMFRSAVERQLAKIGEALSQLARADQGLAARIPELRRVIAFRNVLTDGYDQIDDAGVWRVVEADLAPLRGRIAALLGELGEP